MRRSLLLLLGLTLGWVSAMGSNFTLKTGYAAMDPVLVKAQNTYGILGNSTVFGKFVNLNSLAAPTPYGNSGDGGLTLTFDAVAGCNTDISWTAPTVSTAGYSLVVDSNLLVFDPLGSNDTISLGVAPPNPYTTTFGIGTYRVRYVVRETATNALTYVVINMNVVDPIAPVLTIAADTSAFVNTPGECTYVGVVTPVASATDNCTLAAGIELKMTVTDADGIVLYRDTADGTGAWNLDTLATVLFPLDTTRILITATDASGNTTSKDSIAVVVTDDELPVWDVPFDAVPAPAIDSTFLTSSDASNVCGVQGGIADVPTATDNCGAVTITFAIYDGGMTKIDTSSSGVDLTNYLFPSGVTTIIYYAQDAAGNYAATNYRLDVEVIDDEAPVITAVNDFDFGPYPTSNNGTGDCSADVVIPNLAVSDLCSNGSQMVYEYRVNGGGWILNDSIIETLDADTHLIEYQVTDLAGNTSAIESFLLVVYDDELPTADLTVDTYTLYPQLTCDTLAIIESPITNDNCQILPTEWYHVFAGDTLNQGTGGIAALAYGFGTHTILWHVEDTAGNGVDLTSTVTVADTLAPVVNGITRVAGDSLTDLVADGDGTYGDPFQLYTSDSVGCNPSIIFSFEALDQCAIKVLSNSWNSDVHNLTGVANAVDSVFKLENLPVNYGDTTKIFIYAEDTVGNVGISDTIYVLVNDDEDPTVLATGTLDTIVGNNVGVCSKELTFNALSSFGAFDTCGIDSIIVRLNPGIVLAIDTLYNGPVANANFTFAFPEGTSTVDYQASDLAGNFSTLESFDVTVNDTENPQIFAQDTITVALAASVCAQTNVNLTILGVDVLDNCTDTTNLLASIVNTRTPNGANASGLYPIGVTPVTFTVTDDAGNTANKTVYVNVIDVTGPAFASLPIVERFADIAKCEATFKLQIPASTDACGIDTVKYTIDGVTTVLDSATLANGFTNAETFGKDTTIVTWTIVDASGLSTSGQQKVVVTDSQNPVIPAIANQTFSNDAGVCTSTQTLTLPAGVTDNCEVDSLFFVIDGTQFGNNQNATFAFDAGTTIVTVIAKDETGNADTTMFDVVVNDTEAPVIACPTAGLTVDGDGASCDADFILRSLVPVTDNCSDSASIAFAVTAVNNATSAVTSFNGNVSQTLNVGTYTVTAIATDGAANTETCVFQLTVNNTANTVVTGFPADITVYALANECSRIVTWTQPTASNPCTGPVTVTGSHAPGDEFPLGTTDVVYNFGTFNDTLQITVLDTAKPVITNIPTVLNLTLGAGCQVAANYNVDVQDNCDAQGLDVTYTYEPGSLLGVGTYTNVVTVTDASGNTVTGQFDINVSDVTNPTISASVASITVCIGSPLNYTVTANDNCPTGLVVDYSNTDLQPGNVPTATANETVSITATDAAGNVSTVSVNVVVLPAPTVADAGIDETVNVGNVQLTGNTPGAGENGSWTVVGGTGVFSNNTISNPAVTGLSEGLNIFRYTISSTTCGSTSDDVAITYELPINVGENAPTVFTPNGDGVNDEWNIPGLDPTTYPNAKVTVFNRWGNPVFESELGYATPWDGTFEGSELPVASYYYVIDLGDGSDALSGVISIIR